MNRLVHAMGALALGLSGLLIACGDDGDERRPPPGGNADGGADAGPQPDGGSIADAMPGGDAPVDAEGPVVEVLSPTAPAAGDFSSDAIVTTATLAIDCSVTANPISGDAIDGSSVVVGVEADGEIREVSAVPRGAGVFRGSVSLADLPNGPLTVRCSAADTSPEMLANSDSVATFLDLGPRVQLLAPVADTSYANQADIAFVVSAAPVAAGDTGAMPDLDAVEVRIAGQVVTDVTQQDGTFTATLDFDGAFNPALDGPQTLTVYAPNMRAPEPVVREESVDFVVDSQGPAIAVESPTPGELVSGVLTVTATITDPSGILADSTIATMAGTHEFALANVSGNTYEGTFDTRQLGYGMVFPNIIVRAQDATGNQSSTGFVVALDNQAPVVTLDSPSLREAFLSEGELRCSRLFDPLGADAVDDGETVPQLFELRARAEDFGNAASATSGVLIPIAQVAPEGVDLFLLDDSDNALIVDTDGDGVCDDINPLLEPTSVPSASDEVARIDLGAIPSTGVSDMRFDDYSLTGNDECTTVASEPEEAPPPVCLGTEATRVIRTEIEDHPVIYSVPPLQGQQCMGNAVDAVAANIADGWACAAVRAVDNLGNVGVSAPLRFCVDHDLDQAEGCLPAGSVAPEGDRPSCTGTYDPMTQVVDTTTSCVLPLDFADLFGAAELRRTDL